MNIEYINKLIDEVKLKPLHPELTASEINDLECLLCGDHFQATPKAKIQKFNQFGLNLQCNAKDPSCKCHPV